MAWHLIILVLLAKKKNPQGALSFLAIPYQSGRQRSRSVSSTQQQHGIVRLFLSVFFSHPPTSWDTDRYSQNLAACLDFVLPQCGEQRAATRTIHSWGLNDLQTRSFSAFSLLKSQPAVSKTRKQLCFFGLPSLVPPHTHIHRYQVVLMKLGIGCDFGDSLHLLRDFSLLSALNDALVPVQRQEKTEHCGIQILRFIQLLHRDQLPFFHPHRAPPLDGIQYTVMIHPSVN